MKPMLVSCPRFWQMRGYDFTDRPITYLSLNQDSKCDANCAGCFRYPERTRGLEHLLELPDYERLLDEFVRFGGLAVEISGEGEPLMSRKTLPIIRSATSHGLWTTLITNGHLLSQKSVDELAALKVALVLSLHSLDKDTYERDSGLRGSFDVKMRKIGFVAERFRGTEWRESGRTVKRAAIHWTLQADNLQEVGRARAFCDERGLLLSIAPLAKTGHAETRSDLWVPDEQRLVSVNALGDESIIFADEPDGRVVCGTCRYGLNIGADGKILLDAHGGYEVDIADIRDISFQDALRKQERFSKRMFAELDSFCPVRDPGWKKFLAERRCEAD